MSSGNFLNPLGTTTVQRPCLLLAVPGTASEPGKRKEVSEVTRGLNLLCSRRLSHLSSLPCGGVMWPFPPATLRKQRERGREGGTEKVLPCAPSPGAGLGVIKTRGHLRPYSLQMLKGGKGLEDPHQFGKSLGARDGAQPRRQRTEVTPPE